MGSDSPIKILVGLDIQASAENISSDLKLVLDSISKGNEDHKIKLSIDTKYLDKQVADFKKKVRTIDKEMGSLGKRMTQGMTGGGGSSSDNAVSLKKQDRLYRDFEATQKRLINSAKELSKIDQRLISKDSINDVNAAKQSYTELIERLTSVRKVMSSKEPSNSKLFKQYEHELNKVKIAADKVRVSTDKIGQVSSTKDQSSLFKRIESFQKKLDTQSKTMSKVDIGLLNRDDANVFNESFRNLENLRKKFSSLKAEVSSADLSKSSNIDGFNKDLHELDIVMSNVKDTVGSMGTTTFKEFARVSSQAESLINSFQRALMNNTAAKNGKSSANYMAMEKEYDNIRAAYKIFNDSGGKDVEGLSKAVVKANTALQQNMAQIRLNGEATKSFGDKIKGLISKYSSWFSVTQLVMHGYRTMQQAVRNVIELDTAMTELRKVTDETASAYDNFLDRAGGRAKSIGATLTDTIKATSDFARLGYSIEEAEKISDAALIYKNVGDGISDISVASESIISTMKAFRIGAEGAIGVVDKFNEVGNNFAISSAGVGEALTRSSSAMAAANNTLDETIALATAANTVVQDPQKVGTAMKTVSMFLRAAKTEASEAGIETEGMANSVSKLREEFLQLTGGKVDIQLDEDTFKSTYQIMKDISAVWDDLTDVGRANLLERMGGKRNANVVAAIIENFETAEDALATSLNSVGSASKENEKVLESINGKIAIFKATFQEVSQNLVSNSTVKGVVDFGTTVLKVVGSVTKLTESLGGLKTALGIVFSVGLFKNIDSIWSSLNSKRRQLGDFMSVLKGAAQFREFGVLRNSDLTDASGIKNFTTVDEIFGDTPKTIKQVFANGFSEAAKSVEGSGGRIKKAFAGMKGGISSVLSSLTVAQKAFLGFSAVIGTVMIAWKIYNSNIDKAIERQEAVINKNKESIASYRDLNSAFQVYNSLDSKSSLTPGEQAKLGEAIELINDKLGDRIGVLESASARTAEYTAALREQMVAERELYENEIRQTNAAQKDIFNKQMGRFDLFGGGIHGKSEFSTLDGGKLKSEDQIKTAEIIHNRMKSFETSNSRYGYVGIHQYAAPKTDDIESKISYFLTAKEAYKDLVESGLDATPLAMSLAGFIEENMQLVQPILDSEIQMMLDSSVEEIGDAKSLSSEELLSRISQARLGIISDFSDKYKVDSGIASGIVDNILANDDFFKKYLVEAKEYEKKQEVLESVKSRVERLAKNSSGTSSTSDYKAFIEEINKMSHQGLLDLEQAFSKGEIKTYEQVVDRARQDALRASRELFDSRVWHKSIADIESATQALTNIQNDSSMVIADKSYLTSEAFENLAILAGGEENLTGIIDKQNGFLVENVDALNELIDSSQRSTISNLEAAKSHQYLNYHNLTEQLYDVVSGMDSYDEASINTANSILAQIDAVDLQIAKLALLEQQLLGASSAYDKMAQAKEIDEARDQTSKLSGLFDSLVSSYKNKEFGTEIFKTAFEGLIPEDIYSQFEDAGSQIDAGYNYIQDKLNKYITTDENGDNATVNFDNVANFVEDALATSLGDGLGNVFIGTSLEDFTLNEQIKSLEDFASAMGVTEEVAYALASAIGKYSTSGNDFFSQLNMDSLDGQILAADQKLTDLIEKQKLLFEADEFDYTAYEELQTQIDEVIVKREELAEKAREEVTANIKIDAEIAQAQEEVDRLREALQSSETEAEFNINHEKLSEAKIKLAELLQQKHGLEAPTELAVSIAIEGVQARIQEIKDELSYWTTEDGGTYTLRADISIPNDKREQINNLIAELKGLEEEQINLQTYIELDEGSVQKDITSIDEYEIKDKKFTVQVNASKAMSDLRTIINTLNLIPGNKISTVTLRTNHVTTYTTQRTGGSGRSYSSAFSSGTNGVTKRRMENTLVGELGRELVVDTSKGKYFVVGENGAEMINLPKGSIVFNHKETDRILKNKAKEGAAFASGSGFSFWDKDYTFGKPSSSSSSSSSSSVSYSKPKSTASNKISSVGSNKELAKAKDKVKETAKEVQSEFEKLYRFNNHLLSMNAMSVSDYLSWLDKAYKKAYSSKEITLEDYYKYEEEVYSKLQDLFKDYLSDVEHEISIRSNYDRQSDEILGMYRALMDDVIKEYNAALKSGLTHTDDYVQTLRDKFESYRKAIKDIRDKAENDAKSSLEKMIDFRIGMLKKENDKEKKALNDKLSDLKSFYDQQKKLLQEQRDEEKYLEQQKEKRDNVSNIQNELDSLRMDDSAWAEKRRVELRAELADAAKELKDFEDDKSYELAIDALDKNFESQSEHLERQIDKLAEKLDNPAALYNQALSDIKKNTGNLYSSMLEWNRNYGSGNDNDIKEMYEQFYKALTEYRDVYGNNYKGIDAPNSTKLGYENGNYYSSKISTKSTSTASKPTNSTTKTGSTSTTKAPSLSRGSTIQVKPGSRWYADSYGRGASGTAKGGKILYINSSGTHPYNIDGLGWVRKRDIVGYYTGTSWARSGIHRINELGQEAIFSGTDGSKYKLFSGGEKVFSAKATDFLYRFANAGGNLFDSLVNAFSNNFGSIMPSGSVYNIDTGDIIVNGGLSDERTVSEIRRAQRDNVNYMLKQLGKLGRNNI